MSEPFSLLGHCGLCPCWWGHCPAGGEGVLCAWLALLCRSDPSYCSVTDSSGGSQEKRHQFKNSSKKSRGEPPLRFVLAFCNNFNQQADPESSKVILWKGKVHFWSWQYVLPHHHFTGDSSKQIFCLPRLFLIFLFFYFFIFSFPYSFKGHVASVWFQYIGNVFFFHLVFIKHISQERALK